MLEINPTLRHNVQSAASRLSGFLELVEEESCFDQKKWSGLIRSARDALTIIKEVITPSLIAQETQPYNTAFFSLYEKVFLLSCELYGQEKALDFITKLFSRALGPAYGAMGFQKGSVFDFVRVVSERDAGVGLVVKFPNVTDLEITYQFHTDPFPGLKGKVDHHNLDRCYLAFKVSHLLGDDWTYQTTKHIWEGAPCSEHRIFKIIPERKDN